MPDRPQGTDSLLELLDLEELDVDLYRGVNETSAADWPALFGGQVLAQALRAAGHTVPEGRLPNSLHGYFLRPGRSDRHVILRVARDRDGKSFSARHVVAIQEGEVIFSMSASFHTVKPGGTYEVPKPFPPSRPEDLEESGWVKRFDTTLNLRPLPPLIPTGDGAFPVAARMWVKAKEDVPDDPMVRACVLAYMSDVGSGFGDGQASDLPRGGPSVDHAMWFQDDVPVDDWIYLDMWPVKAGGGRGLYSGAMHSINGTFGAMLTQEILLLAGPPRLKRE